MELFLATEDFKIKGVAYTGFPIIVNAQMELVEEAFDFLVRYCIKRGRVQSPKSWAAYGQSIYDFLGFLEANNWDWRNISVNRDSTILAAYRDWSLGKLGLSVTTVNYRIRIIIKFYQNALRQGWVDSLPYELEDVYVSKPKGFLAHTDASGGVKVSPDVMLKEKFTQIKVLSKSQIKAFLGEIKNPTQHLVARLALQTGLRKEELCTFPMKYIQNPQAYKNLSSQISTTLDPRDMKLKGDKSRIIDVPVGLMADLWQYVLHERNQLESLSKDKHNELFLSQYGTKYNERSLNSLWSRLDLPFKVTPHILRHTYATHTLYELRQKKNVGVDPLMYVRDRLGHSSITTTQKYLHFINQVEDDLMTDYQLEIDKLSMGVL